jgi:hypothetical protein
LLVAIDSPSPLREATSYRLVVSKGRLFSRTLLDGSTAELAKALPLPLGDYQWAVWANVGGKVHPLFLKPRDLSVVKRGKNPIRVPKKIKNWGE